MAEILEADKLPPHRQKPISRQSAIAKGKAYRCRSLIDLQSTCRA